MGNLVCKVLVIFTLSFFSTSAMAIYKCIDKNAAVIYQQLPCKKNQIQHDNIINYGQIKEPKELVELPLKLNNSKLIYVKYPKVWRMSSYDTNVHPGSSGTHYSNTVRVYSDQKGSEVSARFVIHSPLTGRNWGSLTQERQKLMSEKRINNFRKLIIRNAKRYRQDISKITKSELKLDEGYGAIFEYVGKNTNKRNSLFKQSGKLSYFTGIIIQEGKVIELNAICSNAFSSNYRVLKTLTNQVFRIEVKKH